MAFKILHIKINVCQFHLPLVCTRYPLVCMCVYIYMQLQMLHICVYVNWVYSMILASSMDHLSASDMCVYYLFSEVSHLAKSPLLSVLLYTWFLIYHIELSENLFSCICMCYLSWIASLYFVTGLQANQQWSHNQETLHRRSSLKVLPGHYGERELIPLHAVPLTFSFLLFSLWISWSVELGCPELGVVVQR